MATILIVDDEPALRKIVRQMIESEGHVVVEADNGRAALSVFRARNPEIVITDIVMPQKDGIEMIAELRRESPAVRVVAISGGGRTRNLDVLRLAERAGADVVLAKPFTRVELIDALERAVARK